MAFKLNILSFESFKLLILFALATGSYHFFYTMHFQHYKVSYKTKSKMRSFVETGSAETFIYSAFIDQEGNTDANIMTQATVNVIAWQMAEFLQQDMKCCIVDNQNNVRASKMTESSTCCNSEVISVRHIVCPLEGDALSIVKISLAIFNMSCPLDKSYYIVPTVLNTTRKAGEIAVCDNDILYGSIDPKRLVEWFEIHRFLGVDRFTFHPSPTLNSKAKNVLRFYEKEGIVESFELVDPVATFPRGMRKFKFLDYNDEHAALMDCRERHKYYDIAADFDVDELLLTVDTNRNAYKRVLADIFKKEKHTGVLSFYNSIHLLSWEPVNSNHPLFFGRYVETTEPILDRTKHMYMPSRAHVNKGMIHNVPPKWGFKERFVDPTIATIHHYRSCAAEWQSDWKKKGKVAGVLINGTLLHDHVTCDTFPRTRSETAEQILNNKEIINNIKRVCSALDIKT